ncbi:WecB/TagA/CpsF family glycosyltransferase [Alteromonas sp. LMIT006]|uniref:WecB/TagA/CpsF family glycosyltransferase n=1 Tax=Alteromonadaceae TaxID=72275 RepID=UPI0020CA7189|nr:WecB/TagA/CpsF family glycosyltransferase [Alteromonas sp. LMIT006]UTP71925.1 WecB/TagA/CpsF family glycosyltransferase [Alteromonas sp. LMIT006]
MNTINPHSYIETKKDKVFYCALQSSDVLIPDGSGIELAIKIINKISVKKIAGADLFQETMRVLNVSHGKVFLLGSSDKVLASIVKNSKNEFPNVTAKVLSPPYKETFNKNDITVFVNAINDFSPDVLFVGLTAPKQEKLINQLKHDINVSMISGIGAVFDFYAGTVRRPSAFWINLHLEWLVRLIGEPKRLWRRNFVSTPLFLFEIILAKLKIKTFKGNNKSC